MKGNLLALLLAAALLTGSLAAASAEESKSLKIAVAQISLSDEWSTQIANEFTKQCAQRGWEVSIADANMNAEIQQKQIEDYIGFHEYDVLCINPVNPQSVVSTLQQAQENNVPIFAYDGAVDFPGLVTHVSWNQEDTGILTARWIADYARENLGGKLRIGVLTMQTFVHTKARGVAFVEELTRQLGEENITWVFHQDFGDTREAAANIVSNNIMKPIDVIWGVIDNAAMGAVSALTQNNIQNTIVVSAGGWGTEPFAMLRDGSPYYKACIAVSPAAVVAQTLDSIERYYNGEEIEPLQEVELVVVDDSNIADYIQYITK